MNNEIQLEWVEAPKDLLSDHARLGRSILRVWAGLGMIENLQSV